MNMVGYVIYVNYNSYFMSINLLNVDWLRKSYYYY